MKTIERVISHSRNRACSLCDKLVRTISLMKSAKRVETNPKAALHRLTNRKSFTASDIPSLLPLTTTQSNNFRSYFVLLIWLKTFPLFGDHHSMYLSWNLSLPALRKDLSKKLTDFLYKWWEIWKQKQLEKTIAETCEDYIVQW